MVATAERWRPSDPLTAENAAKRAMLSVARRWRALDDEARGLDRHVKTLLDAVAPALLAVYAVGYETTGQLLVTAGDTPTDSAVNGPSWPCADPHRSRPRPGGRTVTD
jgi:transposase